MRTDKLLKGGYRCTDPKTGRILPSHPPSEEEKKMMEINRNNMKKKKVKKV